MGVDGADTEPGALYAYYITPAVMDGLMEAGPNTVQDRVYGELVRCMRAWSPDTRRDSVLHLARDAANVVERVQAACGSLELARVGYEGMVAADLGERGSKRFDRNVRGKMWHAHYWRAAMVARGRDTAEMERRGSDYAAMDRFDRLLWDACLVSMASLVVKDVVRPDGAVERLEGPDPRLLAPWWRDLASDAVAVLVAWTNAMTLSWMIQQLDQVEGPVGDLAEWIDTITGGLEARADRLVGPARSRGRK